MVARLYIKWRPSSVCIRQHHTSSTDWGLSVLFPQLLGKCQGTTRKDGALPALFPISQLCCSMYYLCVNVYCTVQLQPGGYPIAVNKYLYIISHPNLFNPFRTLVLCSIPDWNKRSFLRSVQTGSEAHTASHSIAKEVGGGRFPRGYIGRLETLPLISVQYRG